MKRKHRNHLPGFKAKVVLAALQGDKTLNELEDHSRSTPIRSMSSVGSCWRMPTASSAATAPFY
jgi:hypothetical protein